MKKIISLLLIALSLMYADTPKSCLIWEKNNSDIFRHLDTNQSIKACKKAIKDFPNESQYLDDLGYAHSVNKNNKEAFRCYSKASDMGNTSSQYTIADSYYYGYFIKEDKEKAISLFRELANKGNAQAQNKLAQFYHNGNKPLMQNYEEAMRWYMRAAENNDSWASYSIGEMYQLGQGVQKDIKSAIAWYAKSADLNESTAKRHLGDMYYNGTDVEQNYQEAMNWYIRAAENNTRWWNDGDASAQVKIADMYYAGVGVKKDYKKAFKWFMRAAEQGHSYAQYSIGWMYYNGNWATKNYKKSFKWYMKAAERNSIQAKFEVGRMYFNGQGTKKSYKEAMKWFMKASEQGHPPAESLIGFMYLKGWGVKKNDKKSFQWYLKSAKQGYERAQVVTGFNYYNGAGVKKNYIKAYAWLNQAMSSDIDEGVRIEAMNVFNTLEIIMTPKQIETAQNHDPLKPNKEVENKSVEEKIESSEIYTGTGFFVDKSTVLTNHHIIKNCNRIELIRKGYKSTARIKAKDSINDLAILEADKINNSSLSFRAGKGIRIGDDIIVIGYPLGELLGSGIKLTTGNVSALTGLINDTTSMQLTAPVQPGNSGGALLDKSGNVVGIVVARLKKEQNVNLAIKANVAQMFLDINNIDYSVAMSKDKKDVADIADEAKGSIVQVVCYQ